MKSRFPLFGVFALLATSVAFGADTRTRPPNILFCIADDASYAHFSANGCTWTHTPAFDRVARDGLLFTHAYTPNAKCAPSRAIVLTGRNSWQLEAAANHGGYYPAGYKTFMEALGENGYFTGYTGKGWAPGDPGEIDGHPRHLTGTDFSKLRTKPPASGISPTDYAANFEAFLKKRPKDKPFCFWYGSHEPHRSYEWGSGARLLHTTIDSVDRVPPIWPDDPIVREDMLDYAVEVEYFDAQLGKILDELAATGELDNTIVVVTSDNGMPFPRSKGTAYELSLHMPLAIMWPKGIAHPGRTIGDYVSFIDLAPTFLQLAGVDPKAAGMMPVQGRSLASMFPARAPDATEPGRDSFFFGQERHDVGRPDDVGYPIRGIIGDGLIYLHNFEPSRWPMCDPVTGYLNTDGGPTKTLMLEQNRKGVNHALWVLSFDRRPPDELYDLKRDPDCIVNLAMDSAYQDRMAALRDRLFAELRSQQDPRVFGDGAVFDKYPSASAAKDFYNRYVHHHEKPPTKWVEDSDFEDPSFDPEAPLAPADRVPAVP